MEPDNVDPNRPTMAGPADLGGDPAPARIHNRAQRLARITRRKWGSRAVAAAAVIGLGLGTLATTVTRHDNNSGQASSATVGKALLGMSAPASLWAQRVAEVGPGLQARRIFAGSLSLPSLAKTACNAGMAPVVSFKPGTWSAIANGSKDTALRALAAQLNALPCDSFVTLHHEPSSGASNHLAGEGGTAAQYAAMMTHAAPILGGALGGHVKFGPIGNGWWFNTKGGLSDSELNVWIPSSERAVVDFVAADTYQGTATAETVASKINRMGAWALRTGGIRGLGLGEFNMQTPQGMTDATIALGSNPLFLFGCVWNNDGTGSANAHILTGEMLARFRTALANW